VLLPVVVFRMPIADTVPVRVASMPSTRTVAGSPTFTESMSASVTVVVTDSWPLPSTVMVAVLDPALTERPATRLTAATVPAIGLVSRACATFCWATASSAWAASIWAWSAASCCALAGPLEVRPVLLLPVRLLDDPLPVNPCPDDPVLDDPFPDDPVRLLPELPDLPVLPGPPLLWPALANAACSALIAASRLVSA